MNAPVLSAGLSSRRHQVVAALFATAIVAVAVAAIPFGRVALPANPGFLPAFGAITFVSELVTGSLLLAHARSAQDRGPMRLGLAYLFTALALVPHLLAFPGVFAAAPVIGGSASAVWLWASWHGGFAVLVVAFLVGRPRPLHAR